MKKNTMQIVIIILLVILIAMVFGFGVYYVAREKVEGGPEIIDNDSNPVDNITTTENTDTDKSKEETITCDDCVKDIVLPTVFADRKPVEEKIVLGDKIRVLKISGDSVFIDDKKLTMDIGYTEDIDQVHIFSGEVLMIAISGGRDQYYFYDANLNELFVDMTLDSEYPKSMTQAWASSIYVKDNVITIIGDRYGSSHGMIETEDNKGVAYVCGENPIDNLSNYIGQIGSAKYEIEYLGNGKFSKAKRVEILSTIDENYCN